MGNERTHMALAGIMIIGQHNTYITLRIVFQLIQTGGLGGNGLLKLG
jgi:hypothetical protein